MGTQKVFLWMLLIHAALLQESGTQELRLVNGWNRCVGRIEVYYQGIWGTVCDDNFNMINAHVVCRQLVCGEAIKVLGWSYFGQGSGNISLDDVNCTGNELTIWNCDHAGWFNHNCEHNEDIGVICSESIHESTSPTITSLTGELAHHNGSTHYTTPETEKTFEATHPANEKEITSTTETLERSYGSTTSSKTTHPITQKEETVITGLPPTSQGAVEELKTTTPTSVMDLSTTSADLTTQEIQEKSLRLVNGSDKCRGRVEVFYNRSWGTICDDGWDIYDVQVVCRQLACGEAIQPLFNAAFGRGNGSIFLDEVQCKGNESSLEECSHPPWGKHNCHHKEDAGVICSGPAVTTEIPEVALATSASSFTIRLVNGEDRCQGRLEIFYNGNWGTVCDDGWGLQDAEVVCRQLACGEVIKATTEAYFGEGTGNIVLDKVQCNGNESSIEECRHSGWGAHECNHKEDAGVICSERVSSTTKNPIILTPTGNTSEVPVWALSTQYPNTTPVPAVSTQHPTTPASTSMSLPITQKHTTSGNSLGGTLLTGPSGSFSSPLYPSNYPGNSHCVWIIQVEEGHCIELIFEDFRVEITRFCMFDFVEIFDGPFPTSPSFGKICFNPRKIYTSSSNKIRVVFISDSTVNERGFLAIYQEVPPKNTVTTTIPPPPPPTTTPATTTTLLEDITDFVTLSCLTDYMKAVIGKQYLISKGCFGCNLYLSDTACKPEITSDKFIFYIPYDGCGTKRENNGKISSFSNTVSSSGNGVNPQFRFICKMEPNRNMEVTHNIDEFEFTNQGPRFHVELLFYDSLFSTRPVNNLGYFMNVNQNAYIQISLYSFNRYLTLFIDSCVASPNPYDFTTEYYVMINRGCIRDSTSGLFYSRNRRIIRFIFKSFRFHNNYSTVYIRCKILVCKALDYSSRCYKGCLNTDVNSRPFMLTK